MSFYSQLKHISSSLYGLVLKGRTECLLIIVEKETSTPLKAAIRSVTHFTHIEFFEDLSHSFREAMIVLSLSFKGYDLINKTIEAIGASVSLVAQLTAFNGIDVFKSVAHGIACETRRRSTEFVDVIVSLVSGPVRRGQNADCRNTSSGWNLQLINYSN